MVKINLAPVILAYAVDYLNCALSGVLLFCLIHWITTRSSVLTLQKSKLAANLVVALLGINLFYLLFARMNLACILGSFFLMLLATANYYVFRFKGTELEATDFLAIRTAANVASHYHYKPGSDLVISWVIWLVYAAAEGMVQFHTARSPWQIRLAGLIVELFLVAAFILGTKNVMGTHWSNDGSCHYGYLLHFMLGIRGLFRLRPKGYSSRQVGAIVEKYYNEAASNPQEHRPDIIVIMNESFADLSVLGKEPATNTPVMPFFRSLSDNTIKGYALASVFGGLTANSEYEFLTGNSMAFFPYGFVPYQQFVHGKAYSLVSELKQYGYKCMATHPFLASGWSRPDVYSAFGFDQITFEESYPQKDMPRGYTSDAEMYDYIRNQYEALSKDGSVFLFGVTVQNHGDYANRAQKIDHTVRLTEQTEKYPDADEYLTLVNKSDKAIGELIDYFSKVKRDVIVCFFGDHLPSLNPAFFKDLHEGSFDTLAERQKTKMVPFFIWANYPLEKQTVDCTSLNFLSTRLLEAAGLPLPAYHQFLKKAENELHAINVDGYYSETANDYLPLFQASGREKELLREYQSLVYNNAVDVSHQNQRFFPNRQNKDKADVSGKG